MLCAPNCILMLLIPCPGMVAATIVTLASDGFSEVDAIRDAALARLASKGLRSLPSELFPLAHATGRLTEPWRA